MPPGRSRYGPGPAAYQEPADGDRQRGDSEGRRIPTTRCGGPHRLGSRRSERRIGVEPHPLMRETSGEQVIEAEKNPETDRIGARRPCA